ncbi:MAG: hypothetical protein QM817_13830 [Archangium sp.]
MNLPGDDEWRLVVSWLVSALRPGRPFPLLVLQGEHGCGKSFLARVLRGLIDPSAAPLRRPPREVRDFAIGCRNGWVLAYDNLSGLSPEMSDLLCCVATGGGFSARQLYTDGEEAIFDFRRPVLVNGIDEIATRPDLADRALRVTLARIDRYVSEDELAARVNRVMPRVLGALYDAVSVALRELDATTTRLRAQQLPRLSDFALWTSAAESAFGWTQGAALDTYTRNRGELVETSLEADVVAAAARRLLEQCEDDARGVGVRSWTGTTGDLLEALSRYTTAPPPRDWPQKARALTDRLRRVAPHLRGAGITWTRCEPRTSRGQMYELLLTPSAATSDGVRADDGRPSERPSPTTTRNHGVNDGRDGRDGEFDSTWGRDAETQEDE